MDWSKTIGISILLVFVLSSCTNRKNYGSVYYSRGDVYGDSTLIEGFSTDDYMSHVGTVDEYVESVDLYGSYDSDSLKAILNEEELSFTIIYLDTFGLEKSAFVDTVLVGAKDTIPTLTSTSLEINENLAYDSLTVDSDGVSEVVETMGLIADSSDSVLLINALEVDSVMIFSDSLSKIAIDSNKVANVKSIDSTIVTTQVVLTDTIRVIYRDTTFISAEENRRNQADTREVEKVTIVNVLPIPTKEKISHKEAEDTLNPIIDEVIDSTKSGFNKVEKPILDENNASIDLIMPLKDSAQSLDSAVIIKEIDSNVVLENKEGLYLKELDSIKSINEELRLKAKSSNLGVDTLIYSIFFDIGKRDLVEANKQILMTLVNDANQSNYVLHLSGHADKSGSASFNKLLSEERVKSVLNYIVSKGLDERRVYYQSFGDKYASGNSELNERIVYCRLILEKE